MHPFLVDICQILRKQVGYIHHSKSVNEKHPNKWFIFCLKCHKSNAWNSTIREVFWCTGCKKLKSLELILKMKVCISDFNLTKPWELKKLQKNANTLYDLDNNKASEAHRLSKQIKVRNYKIQTYWLLKSEIFIMKTLY